MISLLVHVARKPDFVTFEQQRCRKEYASAQSDHRLNFSLSFNLPNSINPDQSPKNAAFNQGLHCSRTLLNRFNIPSDDQTAQVV